MYLRLVSIKPCPFSVIEVSLSILIRVDISNSFPAVSSNVTWSPFLNACFTKNSILYVWSVGSINVIFLTSKVGAKL